MELRERLIAQLENLLEDAYEAEALYKEASRQLHNPALSCLFEEDAEERLTFAQRLRHEIFKLEGDPAPTLVPNARERARGRMEQNSAEDSALVHVCHEQELNFIMHFDRAMGVDDLPDETRKVLEKQRRFLVEHLETLELLEEKACAA